MHTRKPTVLELVHAAQRIGAVLGTDRASYCFDGRIALPLFGDWSLAISPDDAGRFRLEACQRDRVRATMWCLASDHARLAELAVAAGAQAAALVV